MKFKILLCLFFFLPFLFNNHLFANEVYNFTNENSDPIPVEKMSFLEGVGPEVDFQKLKYSDWSKKIHNIHSYYNGFWVRVFIKNNSGIMKLGVSHWVNFEKKLFVENSNGIKNFELLSFGDGKYKFFDEDRIWFDYKIEMPIGETTEVYSFYRTKPLHRALSGQERHFSITIRPWDDLLYPQFFRVVRIAVTLCIIIYIFFNTLATYFVSKDENYLWFSVLILSALTASLYLMQYTIGIRPNPHIGQISLCIILISLIQFFRKFLQINIIYKYINKISILVIFSQLFIILFYFYKSFDFPHGEYFTNLKKYPIEPLGIGWLAIFIQFFPPGILFLSFIYFSFISWRKGDKASGYIIIALCLPLLGIPILGLTLLLISLEIINTGIISLIIIPITGFLFMLIPIVISLALAERINQFKREALDQQIKLNNELEERVEERTFELKKINDEVSESIKAASTIQNAILPKIDLDNYGFKQFDYIWEPRDVVGGDFYWIAKKDNWTCIVLADCTGHGIPGAFMTMISSTILDRVSSIEDLSQPDIVLNKLDEFLENALKLNESNEETNFGLDTGVCCFSNEMGILRYSGAKMNLYEKIGDSLNEYKGDKKSIGYESKDHPIAFKTHEMQVNNDSSFFFFSDGVTDQIGGEKNIMYGKKRVLNQVEKFSDVSSVIKGISKDLVEYQKDQKRRDDLSLFGFSIA